MIMLRRARAAGIADHAGEDQGDRACPGRAPQRHPSGGRPGTAAPPVPDQQPDRRGRSQQPQRHPHGHPFGGELPAPAG
jgi:hypothetical protein